MSSPTTAGWPIISPIGRHARACSRRPARWARPSRPISAPSASRPTRAWGASCSSGALLCAGISPKEEKRNLSRSLETEIEAGTPQELPTKAFHQADDLRTPLIAMCIYLRINILSRKHAGRAGQALSLVTLDVDLYGDGQPT